MKANFGLMPPLAEPVRQKRPRYEAYVSRALQSLETALAESPTGSNAS